MTRKARIAPTIQAMIPDTDRRPQRRDRIEQQLRRELSLLIRQEMKEPALLMTAITQVSLSSDMKRATVKVSITGDSQLRHTVFRTLRRSEQFLRTSLYRRLENLKYIPSFTFEPDRTIEYASHMSELISSLDIPEDRDGEDGV